MSDMQSVPVVVISKRPDDAEAINQTLRNAGCAANCLSLSDTKELSSILKDLRPVLLFIFENDPASDRFAHTITQKDKYLPDLPVLAVQARINEEHMAAAMEAGADDLVSLGNKARLQSVAQRELRHCLRSRRLRESEHSAQQLEEQLESLVKESPDAIMHVQEGIVIAANPSWLELLAYVDERDITGTPVMDMFTDESHTAFKGALVACTQGKWTGHTLDAKALASDGSTLPVKIELEAAVYDDEPCVRVSMDMDRARDQNTPKQIVSDSEHHPLTGFYRRQRFLTEMTERLTQPSQGGVWILAYLKPDNIHKVREQLGPISSDDLLLEFAQILQEHVRNNDLYGQFGGDLFMVLMPRGTMRDAVAWGENLRSHLNDQVFEIDSKSLSISCTVGLAQHQPELNDVADLVLKAQKSYQAGHRAGGDQIYAPDLSTEEETHQEGDTVYVKKIQVSLRQDNFRLVYQPVASLENQSQQMFDALLRMVDEDNREIMPNVFLPAARRNGLMKNIDRWVIANAIKFCKNQPQAQLFVRLSFDSIPDESLIGWLQQQLAASQIESSHLVFEVTESDAENHLKEVKELAVALRELKCQVAIEHFGVGSQPLRLLEHIPVNFVKVDGSLMEGISTDKALQHKVRTFVHACTEKSISTVAERVEDANTMAVLWQIGFQYVQGFYVQGPEEIIMTG